MSQLPKLKRPRQALFIDNNSKIVVFDDTDQSEISKPGADWLPALGYNVSGFDGHTYLAGATNSGKSFFINKMVKNDKLRRSIILFTDLHNKDKSLGDLDYIKFDDSGQYNFEWLHKNDSNKILIFDDVQFNKSILTYRDFMLEKARHMKSTIITVNHRLQDYAKTKVALNDARYIVTFPSTNRGNILRYLKYEFEINKDFINELINLSQEQSGQYLIIHKHNPIWFATTENLIKMSVAFDENSNYEIEDDDE